MTRVGDGRREKECMGCLKLSNHLLPPCLPHSLTLDMTHHSFLLCLILEILCKTELWACLHMGCCGSKEWFAKTCAGLLEIGQQLVMMSKFDAKFQFLGDSSDVLLAGNIHEYHHHTLPFHWKKHENHATLRLIFIPQITQSMLTPDKPECKHQSMTRF